MSGMSVAVMKAIFDRQPQYADISTFVETGTGTGQLARCMNSQVENVHTIELSRELYDEAVNRFGHTGIHFHFGDSPLILAELSRELTQRVVWFLDAHYDKTLKGTAAEHASPLKEELQVLRERSQADIVIVDDVHAFGSKRPEPESGWTEISKDFIIQALDEDRIEEAVVFGDQFVVYRSVASPVHVGDSTV